MSSLWEGPIKAAPAYRRRTGAEVSPVDLEFSASCSSRVFLGSLGFTEHHHTFKAAA